MTNTAPPRRRGRPTKAPQSASPAPEATHVADDDQNAPQGRTEALVSPDPSALIAKQLHNWLDSLARGSAHGRN